MKENKILLFNSYCINLEFLMMYEIKEIKILLFNSYSFNFKKREN